MIASLLRRFNAVSIIGRKGRHRNILSAMQRGSPKGSPLKWFYAVGVGRRTGVFSTWPECKEQVDGINNARFRKFATLEEAQAFINECASPTKRTPEKRPPSQSWTSTQERSPQSQPLPSTSPRLLQPPYVQSAQSQPNPTVQPTASSPSSSAQSSVGSQSQPVASNGYQSQESLNGSQKRPAARMDAPNFKVARRNSPENGSNEDRSYSGDDPKVPRPRHIFFGDEASTSRQEQQPGPSWSSNQPIASSNPGPARSESCEPDSRTELSKLKEELERLKVKQTKIEEEILKIVQHIQEKTDGMDILKAEISSLERRIATIEAGKPSSLKEAVSRIRINQDSQPPRQTQMIEPQPLPSIPEPAVIVKAERFENGDGEESLHRNYTYDSENYCIVYTDGCCLSNGKQEARAGLGVFFGDGHVLNMSAPLTDCRPTNNNAEILAAALACNVVKQAGVHTKINIHTDSQFVINCIKDWMPNWERNGWKTSSKKPVENKDQLLILKGAMQGLQVKWTHVPGHSNIHGNEMADRLANQGAGK